MPVGWTAQFDRTFAEIGSFSVSPIAQCHTAAPSPGAAVSSPQRWGSEAGVEIIIGAEGVQRGTLLLSLQGTGAESASFQCRPPSKSGTQLTGTPSRAAMPSASN